MMGLLCCVALNWMMQSERGFGKRECMDTTDYVLRELKLWEGIGGEQRHQNVQRGSISD